MKTIDYIFIHCSAGHGDLESVRKFWREVRRWRGQGYHRFIDYDGEINFLAGWGQTVNGVLGYNDRSCHICYRGGVERNNHNKAVDTRTVYQKESIILSISDALHWLSMKQPIDHIRILGHRDASPDRNGDGIIEPWERIKECPSFDAWKEYLHLAPNKTPPQYINGRLA
jgi:N-acetylmuramoyl-L-alanine amidase